MKAKTFLFLWSIAATMTMVFTIPVVSQTTVIVTPPVNSQGWSTNDTNAGGSVSFVTDATAPGDGAGALQLTTDVTTAAKAQYFHGTNTALSSITELSYYTKQVSATFVGGDP